MVGQQQCDSLMPCIGHQLVLDATFKKKWKLTTKGVTLKIVVWKNMDKHVGFTIL